MSTLQRCGIALACAIRAFARVAPIVLARLAQAVFGMSHATDGLRDWCRLARNVWRVQHESAKIEAYVGGMGVATVDGELLTDANVCVARSRMVRLPWKRASFIGAS